MSPDEMLARSSLVFIGVIQKQQFDSWPRFRLQIPGEEPDRVKYWKLLRRQVSVEMVLRGRESRKVVDVYEVHWTGGTTGNWNSMQNDQRALFLVRAENGRYRVVRDWWRSIFPVTSGPHFRLPLDESRPLWERIALMNFWLERTDDRIRLTHPQFSYFDPGSALSLWRKIKLKRGLVRHPSPHIRLAACRELLGFGGWGQDECWESLSEDLKAHIRDGGYACCSAGNIAIARKRLHDSNASRLWSIYPDLDTRRLMTAVNDGKLRTEICRLYAAEYPGDQDNGCSADGPPATIVTERGDVPLLGPWPIRTGSK